MEEEFEKKSTKKVGIIVAIILVLVIALVTGVILMNSSKKPEKIFSKNVEDMFEMTNKELEEVSKGRVELELSAEMDATDPQIKAANEILKAIKLKLISEYDETQKYFSGNIIALYDNKEALNASAIIKNDKMYFYLKDLFSKYIEVDEEYLEGIDLSTLFEATTETLNKDLLKDIENIILDELKSKEFEKEKVELNGDKVQKSTLKLKPSELTALAQEILEKVNEYENSEEISELIDSIKEVNPDDESGYIEISIFTKGINSDIVKVQFLAVLTDDEEIGGIEIENKSDNETVISFLLNEESTDLDDATKYFELTVKKEDDNKGTMTLTIFSPEDEMSVTLTIKYSVDYDADIQPENIRNSVKMNDLTEKDFEEIQSNIEDNEILSSLVELLGGGIFDKAEEATNNWEDEMDYESYYSNDYESDWEYDEPTIEDIINMYDET